MTWSELENWACDDEDKTAAFKAEVVVRIKLKGQLDIPREDAWSEDTIKAFITEHIESELLDINFEDHGFFDSDMDTETKIEECDEAELCN